MADIESRRWRVDRIWPGQTVVIVAGGSSLTLGQVRQIGIARARGFARVISINDAIYPCWFADIGYACDTDWWEHHQGVPGFRGKRLQLATRVGADVRVCRYPSVGFIEFSGTTGVDPDPQRLRSGGNSAYQSIQLAANLGAAKIVLVALDMDGGPHWFGDHPGALHKSPDWNLRRAQFEALAEAMRERGVLVVNCSLRTKLKAFPRGILETEIRPAA
ncbi:MAG: hypothetical protein KIS96_11630 [Bauldia sp.]|nr:hypothetical protein [Bauldia sp.]